MTPFVCYISPETDEQNEIDQLKLSACYPSECGTVIIFFDDSNENDNDKFIVLRFEILLANRAQTSVSSNAHCRDSLYITNCNPIKDFSVQTTALFHRNHNRLVSMDIFLLIVIAFASDAFSSLSFFPSYL